MGILGEYDLSAARELLVLLTHRGQDASGILWSDGHEFEDAKAMGSPARIQLPDRNASMILGSTRYPTSGRRVCTDKDLESFVGPFRKKDLALSHNGNITNILSIGNRSYDCDTEFIIDQLDKHLQRSSGSLIVAFQALEQEIDGAYSLVGIFKDEMFAYRDSRGFKPLTFGHSQNHWMVASESTVLDMAGMHLERDVYPGELLIFKSDMSMQSYAISQHNPHNHCFFEYVYFAHPAANMENQLVYDVRFRLGRALANAFRKRDLSKPDYVVPVPDTSRPAAQALAEDLGVPMREIILKNRYLERTFIACSQAARNSMAKNKYMYLDDKIRGRDLLVVDDSIVRGTTAKMIVSDLKRRGANKVYFAVTCPPQNHPCYYGIDISTSSELIASNADLESIREFIGADALIYQPMEGLTNAIGIRDTCLACLNGKYPTPHARKIRETITSKTSHRQEGRDYERDA